MQPVPVVLAVRGGDAAAAVAETGEMAQDEVMDPVEALREIAYWLERGRAETHRVKAYRRAADIVAALSVEQRERLGRTR